VITWVTEPVEPPPTLWAFPPASEWPDDDLVGVGADLAPGTLLAAYRAGMFPMPVRRRTLGWWSPLDRGIIPLDGLRVSRSLRRSIRSYDIRVDTALRHVIAACADPARPQGWITKEILDAYDQLHRFGWVHSVEAYDAEGRLAGGLYGVRIGRFFAGESMFHRGRDASKVALVALVDLLRESGATLLDVQWVTPHLASLGAVALPRADYLRHLAAALA
jgi:leucyl/phenylalanyl-tRNA--protein transferase